MISRIIQTEVNVIQTEVWIVLDIMRKPNPIIILLYIQAKCGRKKSHAINLAKFCYFVIFARFEVVTSSASNKFFLGHLRPIIHSIRRKWRHSWRTLRINWSMLTNKERDWSLNV